MRRGSAKQKVAIVLVLLLALLYLVARLDIFYTARQAEQTTPTRPESNPS
jgi:hypothetical protein